MILDSLAPGIVIRAPDKTSARESGDEASHRHGDSLREFRPRKRDDQLPCFDQHRKQCIQVNC